MSRLMTGNADRRSGTAPINAVRKPDHVGPRVIMVGQASRNPFNPHTIQPVVPQNCLSSLCSGQPTGCVLVLVPRKGGFDPSARPQREHHRRQYQYNICPVEIHQSASLWPGIPDFPVSSSMPHSRRFIPPTVRQFLSVNQTLARIAFAIARPISVPCSQTSIPSNSREI